MRKNRKQSTPGLGAAFTLVELLVVISIIAILIALLLPALAMAKQQATSMACLADLRSQGQMVFEYTSTFENAIPFGADNSSIPGGAIYDSFDWDTLLFCNNQGLNPYLFTGAVLGWGWKSMPTKPQVVNYMQKYAAIFMCPGNAEPTLPFAWMDNSGNFHSDGFPCWDTSYAANPAYFWSINLTPKSGPPNETNCRLSNVQSPSDKLAIADANQQTVWGGIGNAPTFDWPQYMVSPGYFPTDYLVWPGGFFAGNFDVTGQFNQPSGLRYRHGQTSATTGWANAVFFDGHADSVPLSRTVPWENAKTAGAMGTSGLRMLNITIDSMPPNAD